MTTETRPPRVGVAIATSTSWEARARLSRRPRHRTVGHHRRAAGPTPGPGRPPKLSDAELVCLAVAQVLLGARSERHWLRFVRDRLGHLFPYGPGQAGDNKRLRAAGHHLSLASATWPWPRRRGAMVPAAGRHPAAVWRLQRDVKRSALWPHAGYGYDRSHSRWYWGFQLYLLCAPDGRPITWCLATPSLASASRPGVVGRRRPPAGTGGGHDHPGR